MPRPVSQPKHWRERRNRAREGRKAGRDGVMESDENEGDDEEEEEEEEEEEGEGEGEEEGEGE